MNESDFLSTYFDIKNCDRISHILNFSLIWSVFECECAEKDAKAVDIDKYIENYTKKTCLGKIEKDIEPIWKYYKNRYVNDGKATDAFNNFIFTNKNQKLEVKTILVDEAPDIDQKLRACLLIVFRLRNNLYHGEKSPKDIIEQNCNFKNANKLLMYMIEARKQN